MSRRPMTQNGEMMPPVTIDQNEFYAALQQLKHVADVKSRLPALSHVLIEGSENEVLVTTTDFACTLSVLLPGSGEGSYLLPVKQTLALVEPETKPKPKKGKKGEKASTAEVTVTIYNDPEDVKARAEEHRKSLAEYKEKLAKYHEAKAAADKAGSSYVQGFGYVTSPSAPTPPPLKAKITTPELKGSMLGLDVDDFPARPKIDWSTTREVDIEELIDTLGWIMSAVSQDEGRPHLNGVFCVGNGEDFSGSGFGLVSTDGHRLHAAPLGYDGDAFLLPLRASEHLMRLMKLAKKGAVAVSVGTTTTTDNKGEKTEHPWVRFDLAPWSLVCKAVDARFPPYEKVIPRKDPIGASIIMQAPAAKLAMAVKRVQKTLGDTTATMRMTLSPSHGTATISGKDVDVESNVDVEIDVDFDVANVTEDFAAGFNARYMIEAAEGLGESMTLQFHKPTDACRIDGGNGRLAITMPMRQ
jgi:DNA polymerase III sliding clamp (beta) subunit (PCNA family)